MPFYALTHLSDADLKRDTHASVSREQTSTAVAIAHIAEFDARRLYVPAGYSSMHAYCVGEFGFSDSAAYKRITVARAARHFPVLFTMLAEGRLNLTAARLVAPHLSAENASELLAATAGLTTSALEQLLLRRFPPVGPSIPVQRKSSLRPIAERISGQAIDTPREAAGQLVLRPVEAAPSPPPPLAPPPLAPQRFLLQVLIEQDTHDTLRRVQELLSHSIPNGDLARVLDRALTVLKVQLESRKFAAANKSRERSRQKATLRARCVPARVRREVWERDQGQCTFVGENGHRCATRKFLEFDHVDPVARGGRATVDRMRLRCRAHNQHEAERVFGAGFMKKKRDRARRADQGVNSAAARPAPVVPAGAAS